ncbi:MAG TPA: nucleoside hydrolase [Chthoniobacterales bacterium]|nr:nucleoside hydrolase [Chthoniobacterales bacterium]
MHGRRRFQLRWRAGLSLGRFIFLLLLAGLATSGQAKNVWIDTDVSIGSPIREADDGFALVLAFHFPEIRILGVSTSYGNAPLEFVDRVAREMTRRFAGPAHLPEKNVFAGAQSPRDLGHQSAASDGLAAAATGSGLTYIALGPLTNLATALQLHPHLRGRIEQIIIIGGSAPGEALPLRIHDANIFKDPQSADIVLRSGIPIVVVPIAVAATLTIDRQDIRQLKAAGPAGEYLSRTSHWWMFFWTDIARFPGAPVFDALGVIAAVKPELVRRETRYAAVDQKNGILSVTRRPNERTRPVRCLSAFQPATRKFLLERLMSR